MRRVTFFAGAKKVTKESTSVDPDRSRHVSDEGIFGLGLLPRSENGGHPWPPPLRGFRVLVAAAGPRKSKAKRSPASPNALLLKGCFQPLTFPERRMRSASGHPEGGRHGCRPFSDQAMDGLSENGDDTTQFLSDFDVTSRCFLLVTFLCTSKEKSLAARRKLCS